MNVIKTTSTGTTGKVSTRHTIIPVAVFVKIWKLAGKGPWGGKGYICQELPCSVAVRRPV